MKLDVTKAWSDRKFRYQRQLTACRFSPCGKYLVAAGCDDHLQRWNLATDARTSLSGHPGWVGDLAFHPDEQRLYSVDYHGGLFCWDYRQETPQSLWKIHDAHVSWARKVAVSPDGKYIATGGNDRVVRLWTADGKPVAKLLGHEGYIFSLLFDPLGGSLLSGDQLGIVRQWEIPSGKQIRQLDLTVLHTRLENFLAHVGGVRSLAIDAGGDLLACGGMTNAKSNSFCPGDPLVVLIDLATGDEKIRLKPSQKADGPMNSLCFLPDGMLAGVGEGASGASLAFWMTDQAAPVHSIKMNSGYQLDLHSDGLRLAVSRFETNGRGGNGRHSTAETYISNDGVIDIYKLHEKVVADGESG
jgi:WD40 repeat protein